MGHPVDNANLRSVYSPSLVMMEYGSFTDCLPPELVVPADSSSTVTRVMVRHHASSWGLATTIGRDCGWKLGPVTTNYNVQ